MQKWIFVVSMLLASSAFADERFTIEVSPSVTQILSVDLPSCQNELPGQDSKVSVPAPVFEFPNLRMTWTGAGKFRLISARIKLVSDALGGGQYRCQISGSEIAAVFGGRTAFDPDMTHQNSCGIRCGNVVIRPEALSTLIQGKLIVLGSELTIDGVRPVSAEIPVSVQYRNF